MILFNILSIIFWTVIISLWSELTLVFLFYIYAAGMYYQYHTFNYHTLGVELYTKKYSILEFVVAHIITTFPFMVRMCIEACIKWRKCSTTRLKEYYKRLYLFHDTRIKKYFNEKQSDLGGVT